MFAIIFHTIFPEIISNSVDIVVKICNNTYSMENKLYPPTLKPAVCKKITKIFVQPKMTLTMAQRIFHTHDR